MDVGGIRLRFRSWGGGASGDVETEHTQIAGGFADFRETGFELRRRIGFDIQKKLVFPGATVDRAALDFLEIDTVLCEGLEGGEQGAGAVGEAHGDGHFMGIWSGRRDFAGGAEQEEAGEIFGVVLDIRSEDDARVVFRGAAPGDTCAALITAVDGFAHASGGVFGGNALEMRMCGEEALALSQRHGVRSHGTKAIERRARTADEMMLDGQDGFRRDGESALEQKVVNADDGSCERVFDGGQKRIREPFADGSESGVKSRPGHRCYSFAE